MAKKAKHALKGFRLAGILLLILGLGIVGSYLLTRFLMISIQTAKLRYEEYQLNKLETYTSERAKLSFQHPRWWPVSAASDYDLQQRNSSRGSNEGLEIEDIGFEERWIPNAGTPSYGYIYVEQTEFETLEEYVESINKPVILKLPIKSQKTTVVREAPTIEYLTIGGLPAIRYQMGKETVFLGGSFGAATSYDYRVIHNGKLYRFANLLTDLYLEDPEKSTEAFLNIISSVKFLD